MKKIICMFFMIISLAIVGCSNSYAKADYASDDMIAQQADRYSKSMSVFNSMDGGYSLTVSKFDGRETLWIGSVDEETVLEIDFCFTLSKGQAKIVHVDEEGNVTTIMECSPETSNEEIVTKNVALKKGKNRLKIVGYDCKNIDLQMLFEEPETN